MQLKNLYLLPLSVAVFALVSTGCSKNNSNPGTSGSVTATVGSTNYNPGTVTAWYSQDSAIFEIAGYNKTSQDTTLLGVIIGTPITLNAVVGANNYIITYDDTHAGKEYIAGSGYGHAAVTVTSLDSTNHKIAGNFTGTLYNFLNPTDSVLVTNGKFSTSYIVAP